jgi:hypothetical protein
MYFKATYRRNPKKDKSDWYYRLVESYRNGLDEIRQRIVLSVEFANEFIYILLNGRKTPNWMHKNSRDSAYIS